MSDLLKDRIAGRIRDLRIDANMTQEEVARLVGVSTRHYVRWERGHALPYWRNIEKIAEAFDITPEAIVDAENSSVPNHPGERILELKREVSALEQKVEALTRLVEAQGHSK